MTDHPTRPAPYVAPAYVGPHPQPRGDEEAMLSTAVSALLLAVVTVLQIGTGWFRWEQARDLNPWSSFALSMVASLLFVLIVLVRGRTLWRGLVGSALALCGVVVSAAPRLLVTLQDVEVIEPMSSDQWQRLYDVAAVISATFVVVAWGVARRQGWLWPLGLAAAPVFVWLTRARLDELRDRFDPSAVERFFLTVTVDLALLMATALTCWLLDLLQRVLFPGVRTG